MLALTLLALSGSSPSAWVEIARQGAVDPAEWAPGAMLGRSAGASPSDPVHEIIVAVKQNNVAELELLLGEVSDPASPRYGQHLSFEEIGRKVRNDEGLAAVRAWLASAGVDSYRDCTITPHGEYLHCRAPTSTWNAALRAEFRTYLPRPQQPRLLGARVHRMAPVVRAPKIHVPSHVAPHLVGILLASELPPVRDLVDAAAAAAGQARSGLGDPFCDSHSCATVDLLKKVYNVTTNGGGLGSQSVFETSGQYMSAADLAAFQKKVRRWRGRTGSEAEG